MPAGTSFLISKGMISDTIEKVVFREKEYIAIELRNQLLHAVHPLGWIHEINLKINGESIPWKDVYFVVRGQWVCTEFIHTIKDIYWYITETAYLYVSGLELPKGEHLVEFELVASQIEVSTLLDEKEIWGKRRQTVVQQATL